MISVKFRSYFAKALLAISLVYGGIACIDSSPKVELAADFSSNDFKQMKQLSPLPQAAADPTNRASKNPDAVSLGRQLFGDWRLSKGEEFACQTCHRGATDDWMTVRADTETDIPSLWNVGHNDWFFWDGRADTLWAQALGPIENPIEHDSNRVEIAFLMSDDDLYRSAYEKVFGDIPDFSDERRFPQPAKPAPHDDEANANWNSMTKEDQHLVNEVFANVGKALAAFQMTLISQKTVFDVFVEGIKEQDQLKVDTLSHSAQKGLKLFLNKGKCIDCHSGPNFSDGQFHDTLLPLTEGRQELEPGRFGGASKILADPFNAAGLYSDDRHGEKARRLKSLKAESGRHRFKTPSLRNVAGTPPYMHDGHFRNLSDVIEFYSEMENSSAHIVRQHPEIEPRHFTEEEKKDLLAFLKALSTPAK